VTRFYLSAGDRVTNGSPGPSLPRDLPRRAVLDRGRRFVRPTPPDDGVLVDRHRVESAPTAATSDTVPTVPRARRGPARPSPR
jgi:hypothetical protein